MKKGSSLIHGAWLVVAITSFVLGAKVFPAGGSKEARAHSKEQANALHETRTSGGSRGSLTGGKGGSEVGAAGESAGGGRVVRVVLSDEDIVSFGEQFRESSSPIDRRLAFSRLLEGLTPENAELVREQIAHLHDRSAEFREFHYAWGAIAGEDAIMFGADTEKDDMSSALAGWASANPGAALAWFDGLDMENDARFNPLLIDRKIPTDALRHGLMRGLVQGLADSDPNAASQFVHGLAATGQKGAEGLMHIVLGAVLRTDSPAEAAGWAENLPDGSLRNQAMGRVAGHFANADPEGAAAWAANFSGQPESSAIIGGVGARWASKDPQAAVTWLNELPAGQGQNSGMRGALREWAGRDPTAAGEYLQAMPASPVRDAAIGGYSRRIAWENPRAAMDWAEAISSPDERLETMIGVGRAWRHKDANGAAEWVRSSGLPENLQQSILNPARDRDDLAR
ncbi:MAG: hypothetical protein VCA73_04980 [Roseibacillus sp.]|jgi:hypothetical protein